MSYIPPSYIRPSARRVRDCRRLPFFCLPTAAAVRARASDLCTGGLRTGGLRTGGLRTGRRRAARQRRLRRLLHDVQEDLLLEHSLKPDRRDRCSRGRLFDEPRTDEDLTDEDLTEDLTGENAPSVEDAVTPTKRADAAAREDF